MRHPLDAPAVDPVDDQTQPVGDHRLAGHRDVAEEVEDQAADGVPRPGGQVGVEQVVDLVDRQPGADPQAAAGQLLDRGLLDVELVHDLAHQLLDEVLQGDQAGRPAVFVDHHGQMELVRLHLAHQVGHPLGLGHEVGLTHVTADGFDPTPLPDDADHVLRVGDADDVVDLLLDGRETTPPGLEGAVERVLDGHVGPDRHHVGAGHHHLTDHGVAELDDRMDEGPFLGLDDVALDGHVGHGQQLGLGDQGAHVAARLADEQVGQADEPGGHHAHRPEADQARHEGGGQQGGPLGMVDGPVLRDGLGEDEDHHDLEDGGGHHPPGAEPADGQDADQGGHHQLADEHQEEDRVEESLGVLGEPDQDLGAPPALVGQALGLGPAHPHQGGLGQGQDGRGDQQDRHGDRRTMSSGPKVVAVIMRGVEQRGHPVEAVEQLLLPPFHPLGLLVDLVVHPEEVEDPVHDEQGDLVVEGHPVLDGVDGGHRRADDHVAEEQMASGGGLDGGRARPALVG